MPSFWPTFTNLGDSRWLLPMALTLICTLPASAAPLRRRWLVAIVLVGGLTLLSKMAFLGWGHGIEALDFTGFSGHAALSGVIYPVTAVLLAGSPPRRRAVFLVAGVCLALAVAYSRLPIGAHSPSEVVAGSLLGLSAAGWSLRAPFVAQRPSVWALSLAAMFGATLPLTMPHLHTHALIVAVSKRFSGHEQVYARPVQRSSPSQK